MILLVLVGGSVARGSDGISRQGAQLFWNDRPVQLVGYSYYGLIGDRSFDAESFLKMLAAHNINFTRFFLILPWPVEPGPNRLPFLRTDQGYDLRAFDESYFSDLRRIVTEAERLGIICQVCMFDRCGLSIGDRLAWTHNPYNEANNVNGLLADQPGGYPAFCQTTGAIAEINAGFIARVAKAIGDRSNVIYEIMNEPYPQLGPLREWHAWVASTIVENLKGRLGSKVISATGVFDDPRIDLFSMHLAGDEARVRAYVDQGKALQRPVILSDDGDFSCMYRPEVTLASARRALALGQHFEHLEFTLTLQREREKRAANGLEAIPAHCQLNLRNLSELVPPLIDRPFVIRGGLQRSEAGFNLAAQVRIDPERDRVLGERSTDGGRTWRSLPVVVNKDSVTSGRLDFMPGARNLVRVVLQDHHEVRWAGPAYPYGAVDEWSVGLGEEIVEAGLMRIRPNVSDGSIRPAMRKGNRCYVTDDSNGGKYAYFRLDSSFPRPASPRVVSVEVQYFDDASGAELVLEYDGTPGAYTAATPILMKGTQTWWDARFTLRDAQFRGSQNDGADFRLSTRQAHESLALRSVTVTLSSSAEKN